MRDVPLVGIIVRNSRGQEEKLDIQIEFSPSQLNMNLRLEGKLGSGQVQTSEAESSTFRSEAATSEPGLCRMKMEGSKVCKEVAGQEDQSKQSSESCPES